MNLEIDATTPPGCTRGGDRDRVYLFDERVVLRIVDLIIEYVGKVEPVGQLTAAAPVPADPVSGAKPG